MSTENQEAWCEQGVNFVIKPPSGGIVEISTKDPRLSGARLYLQTLSDRQDLATQTINSCNACKGAVVNCVLKRGGS